MNHAGDEATRPVLTWKPLLPGALLYDNFRPGTQELAEFISGALRLTAADGTWELTEYERRSGAGYRAMVIKRFHARDEAIAYAEALMSSLRS